MASDLFTFICEYEGGTYVSQVLAIDHEKALVEWATLLRKEQRIEGASDHIAQAACDELYSHIVPLTGLTGVWCWSATVMDDLALVNIVRSAQPS